MTSITLFSSTSPGTKLSAAEFPPESSLLTALHTLAAAASISPSFRNTFTVFNEHKDLLKLFPIRMVGTEPLEAFTPCLEAEVTTATTMQSNSAALLHTLSVRLEQQGRELETLRQGMAGSEEREAQAWAPRLRAAAAKTLLLVHEQDVPRRPLDEDEDEDEDEEPEPEPPCQFQWPLGEDAAGLQGLAALLSVAPKQLLADAGALLMWHFKLIASSCQPDLEHEVGVLQRCITPAMERLWGFECMLVRAYPAIKAAAQRGTQPPA